MRKCLRRIARRETCSNPATVSTTAAATRLAFASSKGSNGVKMPQLTPTSQQLRGSRQRSEKQTHWAAKCGESQRSSSSCDEAKVFLDASGRSAFFRLQYPIIEATRMTTATGGGGLANKQEVAAVADFRSIVAELAQQWDRMNQDTKKIFSDLAATCAAPGTVFPIGETSSLVSCNPAADAVSTIRHRSSLSPTPFSLFASRHLVPTLQSAKRQLSDGRMTTILPIETIRSAVQRAKASFDRLPQSRRQALLEKCAKKRQSSVAGLCCAVEKLRAARIPGASLTHSSRISARQSEIEER